MKDLATTQECNQTGWACKHREMPDEVQSLNHFKGPVGTCPRYVELGYKAVRLKSKLIQ